jgi:hypothetical protein
VTVLVVLLAVIWALVAVAAAFAIGQGIHLADQHAEGPDDDTDELTEPVYVPRSWTA